MSPARHNPTQPSVTSAERQAFLRTAAGFAGRDRTREASRALPEAFGSNAANNAFNESVAILTELKATQMNQLEERGTLAHARALVTAALPTYSKKGLELVAPELLVAEYPMHDGSRPLVPYIQFQRKDGNGEPLPAVPLHVEDGMSGRLVTAPGFTTEDRTAAYAAIAERHWSVPQLGPDANHVAHSRIPNVTLSLLPHAAQGFRDTIGQ